ncbi:MAG: hypothetical protein ACRD0W_17715, partial [Acidimicrobiales bacterium]
RREAVPLAAAVAEANPDIDDDTEDEGADDEQPASPEDAFEPEPDEAPATGASVAPVIADALEAIEGPGDRPTSAGAPTAESGPELGDERAAS